MDRADVIEGLRPVLENGIDNPTFRAAVQSAIALLTPEPVTEEGLRAEGFDNNGTETFTLDLSDRIYPYISYRGGRFRLHTHGVSEDLHIESMQQLREVIKALRGLTNESEASE